MVTPTSPGAEARLAALHASREFTTRLIECSRDCIKVLDLDARLLSMNAGGMEVLEICDFAPLRGSYWPDFWHGETRQAALAAVAEARQGGVGRFVGYFATMGGRPMWWDVVVNAVRNSEDEPEFLLAVSRDVTARWQAEQKIHAMHRFTDEVIEGAAEGIVVYDRELRYVRWNRFMEELTGMGADEVLGRVAPELFPFLREQGIDVLLRRALAGETIVLPDVLVRMPKTGREVWESNRYAPHRDAEGNIIGVIGMIRDVTERRRAEDGLRRALAEVEQLKNRLEEENAYLRRELIANVSHDLRTPLAALRGYLDMLLLKGEALPTETRRSYLEIAARQTDHLGTLISELFELAKLDFKGYQINPEPVHLGELAQDLMQRFQLIAAKKDISLRADIDPEVDYVRADIGLIERALDNLLENALKHTRPGGRVSLAVQRHRQWVVAQISDSGSGISEDALPHIFERFYQADRSRTIDASSAGLGLAIVKRILELHHSEIRVASSASAGTTFSFALPILSGGDLSAGLH